MITGVVSKHGVPYVELFMGGKLWQAVIDSGFNGYLELPEELRSAVKPRYRGSQTSHLAGEVVIIEDAFTVEFQFDGKTHRAAATFVAGSQILIGTRLLRDYRLEISFPARTVRLERVA